MQVSLWRCHQGWGLHMLTCAIMRTHSHDSSTLKRPKYSKYSCFDKGRCYSLLVGKFQNLWHLRGKYNLCSSSKEKKPVFSVTFASIQYLCLWGWHLIKKVCSVSGFQPDFGRICSSSSALLSLFFVWFTFVILFGLLQSDLVPTSMNVLVQQDQTEKSRNYPNGKASWGRQTCSFKYTVDLELVVMCVAITSPTYHLGKSCLKMH